MSNVTYGITRTVNLGNYTSIKIQCGVTLEIPTKTTNDLEQHYQEIKKFVDEKIEQELEAIEVANK